MGMAGLGRAVLPLAAEAVGGALQSQLQQAAMGPANMQQGRREATPLNTDQVLRDRDANNRFTGQQSARQMGREEDAYRNRRGFDESGRRSGAEFDASLINDVSNSGFARSAALNAANALNDQYMNAGQRLNNAASDSQRAANDAMATLASVFR